MSSPPPVPHAFRALVEHAHDLLVLLDASGCVRYANPSLERILGFDSQAMVGRTVLELAHATGREEVQAALSRLLASPGKHMHFRVRMCHRDGGVRVGLGQGANLLEDPLVRAVVVSVRDVTEAEEREAALQKSDERFRLLAERAHDIIARHRLLPKPQVEYIGPSVERVTGYPASAFYDDPYLHAKLIHPEDRSRLALLLQRAPEELSIPITMRWVCKDGETVWIEQRLTPEVDELGRLVAYDSIGRDVTDQVRLEQDLRRSHKLEAVGRLAGGIAHDFNNLLGVILLCAERLKRATERAPELTQWVDMTLDSARRGASLTQQLLAFARREAARGGHCDAHLVVRELQPMLTRLLPEDVRLHVELHAHQSTIRVDPNQLEQVLINLVVNARDAMPRGGTIRLTTDNAPAASRASARGTTDRSMPLGLVLRVSDQGTGLPAEAQDRIFEPFFTTKLPAQGVGLGLSVVYGIVTQSGGHVSVESKAGQGTAFTLRWPVFEPGAISSVGAEQAPAGGDESLLLVEDDALLRMLEGDMLERLGYRVLRAESAEQAAHLFERAPEPVELLLTDIVLPDSSGVVLAERLRALSPKLRVVYSTGHDDAELARRGLEGDQSRLLIKPFTEHELAVAVRSALDAEPGEAGGGSPR